MIEELQKRIDDLRAVEHWLKFNLTMLQSTIQALEVQCATFKAYDAWMPPGANESAASDSAGMPQTPAFDPAGWWDLLQTQFNQVAAMALSSSPAAGGFQPAAHAAPSDSPSDTATAEPAHPAKQSARSAASPPSGQTRRAAKMPPPGKTATPPKKTAPAKTRKARVPK